MKDWILAVACWLLLPVIFLAFLIYSLGLMVALLLDQVWLWKGRKQSEGDQQCLRDDPPGEELSLSLNKQVEQHEGVTFMAHTPFSPAQEPSVPASEPAPPVVTPLHQNETYTSFCADLADYARLRYTRFSQAESARLFTCYLCHQAQQRELIASKRATLAPRTPGEQGEQE